MAKWRCLCGQAMNDHQVPGENTWLVFPETTWVTMPTDENDNINCYSLPDPAFDVYVCPACGRLTVVGADGRIAAFYRRENV